MKLICLKDTWYFDEDDDQKAHIDVQLDADLKTMKVIAYIT